MNPISYVSRFVSGTHDDKAQSEINNVIARVTQLSGAEAQSETMRAIDHSIAAEIGVLSRNCSDQLIATLKQQDPPLLGEAIKAGLNEVAKTLLELIPSEIDAPDRFGKTPLILAVERENIEMVKTLASAGASPHATDARGCTALIWAAMTGIVDLVKSLFGAGAIQSVDVQDKMGNTALMAAVRRGYFDIAKVLITEGQANVLLANRAGETALSLARERADPELLALVTDAFRASRAGVSALAKHEQAASMAVKLRDDVQAAKDLLKNPDANIETLNDQGDTPLQVAVKAGDRNLIAEPHAHGADMNALDHERADPSIAVSQQQDPPFFDFAVNAEPDSEAEESLDVLLSEPDVPDHQEHTDQLISLPRNHDPSLLHQAIDARLDDEAKTSLDVLSSETDAPDPSQKIPWALFVESRNIGHYDTSPPLVRATMAKKMSEVEDLLRGDASQIVNGQDRNGNTALIVAINRGYLKIAEILIKTGHANASLANHAGQTPLSLAVQDDDEELVDLLCTHGANVNARDEDGRTAVMAAYDASNKGMVEHLISMGADIRLADNEGRTLLHLAARQGDDEGVRSLCESGADVNAQDVNGFSPLVHAIQSGNPDAVEVLLSNAADVNARDNEGRTVMFHLSDNQSSYGWHSTAFKATFDRLFEAGARLEAMDEKVLEKLYPQWGFDQAQRVRLGLHVTGFASDSRG